ncbi:unnamed protein product [Eruca vesicaria subsp. sativa]|uniref:LIM zinc-binding domain-containing protein n=1 Tax=Eruca vesicaria subsp. sativa TaxID=29727 RepID=A0ABC8KBI5_ERUVS|nr:unnamed protein product [Eruca vesicaria subsp. sativa]
MGCFSCCKPSTSEDDPFEAETDIVKQVSSYDAHVEEDEQLALVLQVSKQEAEDERRRTRDLEKEHAQEIGERPQNYDNSSSSSLKGKKDGQTSEETDKRKQFEEQVKQQDEQLAVPPPPPPPPPLPLDEHSNISSEALLDEDDEQRESLKEKVQTKPSEDDDGKLVEVIPPPSMSCGGCHFEIDLGGGGSVVDVLGVPWHRECFSCGACHIPFAIDEVQNHVSNLRGKFHKACYDRYCYVCKDKMKMSCNFHHFWEGKYCPSHETDGTSKCFSCERLEPRETNFVMLDDGRWLCLECLDSAVMDTYQVQALHFEIRDFFDGLNMKIHKEFPLLLVERQALYQAEKGENIDNQHGVVTRGICLSEVQIVTSVSKGPEKEPSKQPLGPLATESQTLVSGCPVTAILILYGLPRLLTGSIMAHEMMHAYLRLNGFNNLNNVVEEGLCQVLGHMWLETQRYANVDGDVAAASSSSPSNEGKKGESPEYEKKLVEFCKNQIETDDSPVYGVGFRKVNDMVTNSSLQETLKKILGRSRG